MDGREIASRRTYYKINQIDLALEINVFPTTLSDIENNKIELSDKEYERVLEVVERLGKQECRVAV